MSNCKQVLILFIFVAVLFSGQGVNAQQTEIETLIRDVSADTQKGAIFGYTYQMKFSYNRRGKFGSGRKFTRLYEAIIPNRFSLKRTYRHPLLLTYDSEKVITTYDIEYMRNKLVEDIERVEREAEENSNEQPDQNDGGYWTISFRAGDRGVKIDIIRLLENAAFSNLQKSERGGRKVVSIDFSPKTDSKLESYLSYLGKIEGKVWIDEADRRIMRIEGFPLGSFAAIKDLSAEEREQRTVFLFAQTRVAEGYWFPQNVVIDFTKNPEIFDTLRIEYIFDKYSKSSTEVRSSALETPDGAEKEVPEEKQKTDKQKVEKREKDQ